MKRNLLFIALMFTTGSLLAADAKDEITAAAKKLGEAANYSWKATTEMGGGPGGGQGQGRGRGGLTGGQTEKGGFTVLTYKFGDNTSMAVLKGDKGAAQTQDGWQTLAEMIDAASGGGGGGGRGGAFRARQLQNFKAPAAEVEALAGRVKELTKADDVYSGDFTEDGAKKTVFPGNRAGGGNGPEITDASGSIKFWIKDGAVIKYEYTVKAKIAFGGNDPRDMERKTTIEIKDVGTTKVEVPEEAKKKLS